MKIIIDPLEKALTSLNKALKRAAHDPKDLELRDACIQRFEYTYELCVRLIKRYLKQEMPVINDIDQLNYRDLLRVACDAGLVQKIEEWFQYREARNQTSHAYDEHKAKAVYAVLPAFADQASYLLAQLKERLKP